MELDPENTTYHQLTGYTLEGLNSITIEIGKPWWIHLHVKPPCSPKSAVLGVTNYTYYYLLSLINKLPLEEAPNFTRIPSEVEKKATITLNEHVFRKPAMARLALHPPLNSFPKAIFGAAILIPLLSSHPKPDNTGKFA